MNKATLILDILGDLREMNMEENLLLRGVVIGLKIQSANTGVVGEEENREVS